MPGGIVELFQAAGLAGASGHRAFVPALALGVWHHMDNNFALSESFAWLADPVVMGVLGVLTLVEPMAEMNPDAPEIVNLSLMLPKLASGFVVVAASVGHMTNDNLPAMVASGILGAGAAFTVDGLRAEVKHSVDETLSDTTDGHSTKVIGTAETAWAAALSIAAVVAPVVAAVGILLLVGIWWGGRRAAKAKFVGCPACGERIEASTREAVAVLAHFGALEQLDH